MIDNKEISFAEWLLQLIHLRDKVILPGRVTVSKEPYITPNGFDTISFQKRLFQEYNKQYPTKPNSLRYKK